MEDEYVKIPLTPTRKKIIKALSLYGRKTKDELGVIIKEPRITTYDNLKKLEEYGLTECILEKREQRGRPKVFWDLTKDAMDIMLYMGFTEGFVVKLFPGIL